MSLTTAQLNTLYTAMQADANVTPLLAVGNQGAIAAYYNAASAQNVWNPAFPVSVLPSCIVGSAFAALTLQLQNTYFAMTQATTLDGTNPNVQATFAFIFGAGSQTILNFAALAGRLATRFEDLFTTNSVVGQGLYGYVVQVSDIAAALVVA